MAGKVTTCPAGRVTPGRVAFRLALLLRFVDVISRGWRYFSGLTLFLGLGVDVISRGVDVISRGWRYFAVIFSDFCRHSRDLTSFWRVFSLYFLTMFLTSPFWHPNARLWRFWHRNARFLDPSQYIHRKVRFFYFLNFWSRNLCLSGIYWQDLKISYFMIKLANLTILPLFFGSMGLKIGQNV